MEKNGLEEEASGMVYFLALVVITWMFALQLLIKQYIYVLCICLYIYLVIKRKSHSASIYDVYLLNMKELFCVTDITVNKINSLF